MMMIKKKKTTASTTTRDDGVVVGFAKQIENNLVALVMATMTGGEGKRRTLRSTLRRITQRDLDDFQEVKPAVSEMSAVAGRRFEDPSSQKPVFGRSVPAAKFRFPSGFNALSAERTAREEKLRVSGPPASYRPGFSFTSCFAGDANSSSRENSAPEPGVPGSASFGAFEDIAPETSDGRGGAPMSVAARTMLNLEERRLTGLPQGQAPASPGTPHSPLGAGMNPEDDGADVHDPYAEYAARVRAKVAAEKRAVAKDAAARVGSPKSVPASAPGDGSAKIDPQTLTNDGSFAFGATSLPTPQGDGQQYGFRFVAVNAGSSTDMSMGGSASDADLARNEGGFFDCYDGETGTLSHSAPRRMAKLAEKRAAEAARNVEKVKPGEKYLPLEALRRDQVRISQSSIQPLKWPDPGHTLALHTQGGNHWSLVVRTVLRAVGCEIQGEGDAALLDFVQVECFLPNTTETQRKRWYLCSNDLDWGIVRGAALRDMEPRLPGEPVPSSPKLLCIVHLPSDLANKVANTAAGQHLTTTADLRRQQYASQTRGAGNSVGYNPALDSSASQRRPKLNKSSSYGKFTNNPELPPPWPIHVPPAPPSNSREIMTLSARRRDVSSLYSKDEVARYSRPKEKALSAAAGRSTATVKKPNLSPKREKQLHMAAYYKNRIENFTTVVQTKPLHASRASMLGLDLLD